MFTPTWKHIQNETCFRIMPLKLEKIISTVDESPFYCLVLLLSVYGILISITY